MSTYKSGVKQNFKRGKKPTQAQFWEWMDRIFFKDESVPVENISIGESELVSVSGTATWDVTTMGTNAYMELTEDTTLVITNWQVGQFLNLALKQDGTGGWNITLPVGMKVGYGGLGNVNLSTDPNAEDNISLFKSTFSERAAIITNFT